jgi:cysteinyl-tRNA synthetase
MIPGPATRLFYSAARTRNCPRDYHSAVAKVSTYLPPPKGRFRRRPGLPIGYTRCFSSSDNSPEPQSISLFDSLSESIQPLPSTEGKGLGWYTCGPTTYAPAHLGHARTYVCLDIVRRVVEARASRTDNIIPPLFVMNITDVDDKILTAAAEMKVSPIALARKFEAEFWRDLDALNCLRPHVVTRVTECVESHIVPFIQRLVDQGFAYEIDDGVYFHVRAFNEKLGTVTKYGKLAPAAAAQDFEITGRNESVAKTSQKKDPRDFVLWKRRKHEPLSWSSPWGEGRPGWHIECSSMIEEIQSRFEATHLFLVHAGGVDLKFPHHTNEIAQSEAYRQGKWVGCLPTLVAALIGDVGFMFYLLAAMITGYYLAQLPFSSLTLLFFDHSTDSSLGPHRPFAH